MERYWVFLIEEYESSGGMTDLLTTCSCMGDAKMSIVNKLTKDYKGKYPEKAFIRNQTGYWFHIFDSKKECIIKDDWDKFWE